MDYRKRSIIKIDMTEYLKNILDDLPIKYQGEAIITVMNHIFKVNKTAHKPSKGDAHELHTIVEKLLFLCKISRPVILNGVELITT